MSWNSKKLLIIILSIISLFLIVGGYFFIKSRQAIKVRETSRTISSTTAPAISNPITEKPSVITKKLPILIYHYVEINQDKRDTFRDTLNIKPYIFEQQILTLQKAGYKLIWPSEISEFLNDTSGQKYVMITFDDGYGTFYTQTYPFIKKLNVKVTNYIIYDKLGLLNYMTKPQVHEVVKDGLVEIGSHTLTHPNLTKLSPQELRRQLSDSRALIEKEFGVSVKSFCYPYGYYNQATIPFVKEAGYDNAVTTHEGTIFHSDNMYEIKRFRPGYLTGQDLLDKISKDNN